MSAAKHQKIIQKEVARSELEAIEGDAREALCYQDRQFRITVREYQRQSGNVVNQAVRESSENETVTMIQEFQGFQNRYAGRIEEHGRRVAQVIGSAARDAPRGQRSHILHEHQVVLREK